MRKQPGMRRCSTRTSPTTWRISSATASVEPVYVGLILDASVVIRDAPVHPVTLQIARLAGRIEGDQVAQGVTIAFEDLLIAATACNSASESPATSVTSRSCPA
jgi:hypothetical protein